MGQPRPPWREKQAHQPTTHRMFTKRHRLSRLVMARHNVAVFYPSCRPIVRRRSCRCLRRFGPVWTCNPKPPAHRAMAGPNQLRENPASKNRSQAATIPKQAIAGAESHQRRFCFGRGLSPFSFRDCSGSPRRGSRRADCPRPSPAPARRSRPRPCSRWRSSAARCASSRRATCLPSGSRRRR